MREICYAVKRACKAAMEAYIDDMGGVGGTNKEIEYKKNLNLFCGRSNIASNSTDEERDG